MATTLYNPSTGQTAVSNSSTTAAQINAALASGWQQVNTSTNTSTSNTSTSSPQNQTQPQPVNNGSVLFSAYGYTVYSNAKVTQITAPDGSGRTAVMWTNPDGSNVWEITSGPNVQKYAPQYYNSSGTATSSSTSTPATSTIPVSLYNPTTGQIAYTNSSTTAAQVQAALAAGWQQSTPTSTPATTPQNGLGNQATSTYGATTQNPTAESQSLQEEQAIATNAGTSGLISQSFLTNLQNDPAVVAFYVNALTYGGYTIGDVVNDMKRRELASQGNVQANNLIIIDPEQTSSQYKATAAGQQSVTTTQTLIPTSSLAGMVNPDILKYGANMPDDLFKELVPINDPTSQTYKDAVAAVLATYYDITNDQAKATTEQEKAVADTNYAQFKSDLQTKYGIALSDNANTAWTQIEGLVNTSSQNGIQGSGMQYQQIEQYLNSIRQKDQQNRNQELTDQQKEDQTYYTSTATAAQIAALTPEQRAAYGLTPSAEVAQDLSVSNIMAKNPSWTQAMAQAAHDAVIDQYGNYRSTLYQTYYSKLSTSAQTEEATAESAVTQDALNKEAAAYKAYDTTQPLNVQPSTTGGETTPVTSTNTNNTNTITPAAASSAAAAAANISKLYSPTGQEADVTSTTTADQISAALKAGWSTTAPTTIPTSSTPSSSSSSSASSAGTVSTSTPQPPVQTPASATSSTYKIVSGDTLSAIAAKNNTTVAKLASLNNISNPNYIQAGQTIKLS